MEQILYKLIVNRSGGHTKQHEVVFTPPNRDPDGHTVTQLVCSSFSNCKFTFRKASNEVFVLFTSREQPNYTVNLNLFVDTSREQLAIQMECYDSPMAEGYVTISYVDARTDFDKRFHESLESRLT